MKKQNKRRALDTTLIIVGIATFVFTVVMMIFFVMFQQIPDTLCERFYTCVVGECGIAGVIQVVKTIVSKKQCACMDSAEDAECIDENISDDINNLEI